MISVNFLNDRFITFYSLFFSVSGLQGLNLVNNVTDPVYGNMSKMDVKVIVVRLP